MLELSARFVGARSIPFHIEVSARHAMNYAASVGDTNSVYFDDERAEGVIAPPMLGVALTWPVSAKLRTYWEKEGFPGEVLERQVHYTEFLEWHRPIVPGMRLTVTGEVVAILPQLGGTHMVVRYDVRDEADNPVFVEHIGAVLRDVKCTDGEKGREHVPILPRPAQNDSPVWEVGIPIDPLAAFIYDGCAELPFPIHTSLRFAHQVGLPRPILQGTATLALAVRELTNREAEADPRRVRALGCRFTGMVFPGSAIQVRLLERRVVDPGLDELLFEVRNADGKRALRDGVLRLAPAKEG